MSPQRALVAGPRPGEDLPRLDDERHNDAWDCYWSISDPLVMRIDQPARIDGKRFHQGEIVIIRRGVIMEVCGKSRK